ncbi:MAG: FprA family A-type flavoprotein [Thermoleophilia bacterium]|nr:FprA family A-type flavoprotein [Thermoleophilia bacterium]
MERYQLKDEIWWVGAIDWNTRDFHGYDTVRGTTYNAYLVLDDKVALIDGCREEFGHETLARVRGCCGMRPVDYLIINHVEPDHSGAIPELIQKLTPERIFCSKRGKETLALYFGAALVESWDLQVVATGDELTLGRNTLQFIEAPMLHWPDSMFTYVKEAKTLLPNDAFGQHLATSKRFADEVDINIVMEEASKYYANILMPFGSPIQKMLAKIGEMGLEIEAIGPSHGVIWRRPEDVARILQAYAAWSAAKAPERVTLIYDTMWHSTEKMTMAICDGVVQEGVECSVLKLSVSPRSEAAHQVLESRAFLLGSPTLNNGIFPTVGGFLTYIKGLRPKGRIAGAYGSCGWAGGAVKQIDAEFRELGLETMDPIEVKYMPTDEQLDACVELGREVARRVKAMGE